MPAKPYRGVLESITPKATGATPPPPSNLDVFTGQPISIKSMSPVDRTLSRAFIEAHTHAGARVDLTPWTKRATWTPRVKQPWTDINVTLALPWANRSLVPQNGDVLVVRDERGFPQAWGYVVTEPSPGIEGGLANAGSRSSAPIQVRAVSWLQYLASVQLFTAPYSLAGRTESVGTLFTLEDWETRVYSLMGSLTSGSLGQALVTAVNAMCRIELPPTLGGGSLADAITVVYDNASASQARLSDLWCDPVKGPRIMGTGGYFPESTNVLDFLRGIFVPDPRLVEFWETLAPLAQESQAARDKLGANPVLVYRIAPFRTQSLASFLSETSATQQSGAAQPTQTLATGGTDAPVVVADPDRALLAAYEVPSWQPSRGSFVSIDRDFVQFPSPQRTDAERVNLVTIGLPTMPDAPIRFWPEAGLPYVDEASVRRYGVRLYQPNWPFFAPTTTAPTANTALGTVAQQGATAGALGANSGGTGNGETLVGYMRAVAGLAAMMFLGVERFYSGRFTLGTLTGKVDIGRPVTLAFPGGGTFGAYAEAVTHEANFDGPQGQCQGSSAVQYSRGVYNPPTVREGPERQAVQVETVKPVAQKKATSITPAASGCQEGTRAGAWPTSITAVDLARIPASLRPWALSRGFLDSYFGASGSDQERRVYVSAACARVLEYYWRQKFPDAQIRVLSNVRPVSSADPNANHSSGASIDFSIVLPTGPLGACQTWGALFRCSAARRTPLGGRGLYLNLSPGGITGSTSELAGRSSSTRQPAPGGSSAGVHYDYRGTFGFRPNAPANQWVGLDTTGDGTDDYMLGGVNSAETLPLLTERVPSVALYYRQQGKNDSFPPVVSNTVPNALQMLGLEPWCGD